MRKVMDRKYKLLIIDDNVELLAALDSFFKSKGHEVLTAANGLEGIKLIENETPAFDLLLTDLIMPHVSGVGIISIVKKKYPRLPVVAITGWGEFPEALAAEAKADYVLKKPFSLEKLEKIIDKIVNAEEDRGQS